MPQLNGFGFNVVKAASPTQAFKMIAEDQRSERTKHNVTLPLLESGFVFLIHPRLLKIEGHAFN